MGWPWLTRTAAVAYAAKALANSSSIEPRKAGMSSGIADVAPVLPGGRAQVVRGLAPLRPEAVERGAKTITISGIWK